MDPAGKETAGFFRGLMGRSLRSAESDTIEESPSAIKTPASMSESVFPKSVS